jgi:hypothetical protein
VTPADRRALGVLNDLTAEGQFVRPGAFGDTLWSTKRASGNCSCPYARQAGKVLRRLHAQGFAEWRHEGSSWGWQITRAGKAALT